MFSWLNKLFSRNYAKGCPVHFQSEATECGAVSLGMIMEYYGVILTLEVLRDECQVSRDGCKASSLLQTARKYGFQANGFHAPTPDSILQCQMPAIIFWEFNHFVVCIGKEGDQWVLHDPAVGKRLVSEEEMSKSFTGLILEIIPGPGFHKTGKKPSFLWSLVALTAPGMSEMSLLFLIGLFLIPGTILRPNMNSLMIDYYFQHGYINWGTPLLFLGLFFLLITAGLIFFEQKTLLFLNLKMSVCNSYLLIKKMFRLPLHFFQVRFSGDLTQCLQYSEIISNFVSEKMVRNTLNLLSIILFGLLLFQFDSILGALVVIFVLILMLILISFFDRKKVNSTRETFTNAKLMGRVVHGISMIESIKSSGMENEFFIFWNDLYKKCAKVRMELHDQDLFLEFLQST